jgi:hypothetical protein
MLGLPDLYETKNQGSIVGVWDLMDYGSWGVTGRGYDPVPPSAWCRKLLGWLEPKEITDDVSISDVYSVEASSESVYQLPILGSDTEYFLVCNSTNPPADQVDGLQIWHVDEGVIDGRSFQNRLYSNTVNNYSHATVTLVSADYTIPYNKYFSPKNLWPGIKTIFSIPYSNSYQGISSGITISGIVCNNGKASFDVKYIKMAPLVKLKKLINYPNPAGTAAIINNQNVLTKILLNMDRVPLELELVIYNIAGEKVRVADYRDLKLRTDITNDYNIYFEYAWDGKNDSNQDVAPGVYFYKVVADNTIGTGKMALIR